MKILERFIAVDNGGLWPQLRLACEGEIYMTGFNRPSHGKTQGDIDCWKSADGGRLFSYAGTPVRHEPGCNRMNNVSGFAQNGDFLTIVSGYSNRPEIIYDDEKYLSEYFYKSEVLVPVAARSADGGKTYSAKPLNYCFAGESIIPFGEIIGIGNGALAASIYVLGAVKTVDFKNCKRRAGILVSRDDGDTWGEFYEIDRDINETSILYLDGNRMIAAARTAEKQHIRLYMSNDGGVSWKFMEDGSMINQMPASLTRLNDGRILMCYGVRNNQKSIIFRTADERGENWSEPSVLAVLDGAGDMGYPSSVQLGDGTIVTAYYADGSTVHNRYHTGIIRWEI
ncbi:MAG: exo-alpha-sialidase [Clostridia bacterium]